MHSIYIVDIIALKKIMVEKRLDKITDLSEATGINRNTLSKVINGTIRPSATVIEKLMCALDIPPYIAGTIFFVPTLLNTQDIKQTV